MLNITPDLADCHSGWLRLALGFCFFLASGGAPATADQCAGDSAAAVQEIAPGVFLRPGREGRLFVDHDIANIGFIVGRDCVAIIDAGGSYAEGEALGCAVRAHTAVPICYLILTHHHPDHILGATPLAEQGAQVIGHEKLAQAQAQTGDFYLSRLAEQYQQPSVALRETLVVPERTVAVGAPLALDLGARVVHITAHPAAHTNNDLSLFDPQTATLWLSDLLFVEQIPAIDVSAKGWLAVLDELARQPALRVVPGHGPIAAWPQAAGPIRDYLRALRTEARAWLDQGGDLATAQQTLGQSLRSQWRLFDEYHPRNVGKVYTELEWED